MRTLHASKELRTKFIEAAKFITTNFKHDLKFPSNAHQLVSEAGLRDVLNKRIKTDFIANKTVRYTEDSVVSQSTHSRYIVQPGYIIDQLMKEELASLLSCPVNRVKSRFSYWYPPGGYTQWNAQSSFPGWKVYFTYADRPNESFIRWMENGEVKTSFNTGFDLRMFYAGEDKEFWSAIYSSKSDVLISEYNVLNG